MKKYEVVIHYEGAISYIIEADSALEAEKMAKKEFDEATPLEDIAEGLMFHCDDCWEIQEG